MGKISGPTSEELRQTLNESHYIDKELADMICEAYDEGRIGVKWFMMRTKENIKRMCGMIAELQYNFDFKCVIEEQQSLYNRNPEFDDTPPNTYVPMQYYILNIYF
jgi:hypothetical protein